MDAPSTSSQPTPLETKPPLPEMRPASVRAERVQSGNTVLLRVPNGDVRAVKIEKDTTVNMGRLGNFLANNLIGKPYGGSFEIINKGLKPLAPSVIQEVEETDANNELINDGEFVQPLTTEEIHALKEAGIHASEIIKKQIELHANYSLKTEYSKEKYKKRKEAKYMKAITIVEPTLFNVCEYWFRKDQARIRDLRPDALAQVINLASIRAGGRYLAVDDASGMLVSGILERMGGQGRLITITHTESSPAYPVLPNMNFLPHVVIPVMKSLNWATAEEEHQPIMAPSDLPPSEVRSDRQKSRLRKRKAATDALTETRNDLFAGEFDGLIVASEYDPWSIVERLNPYLSGSASIVVHTPFVQVAADFHNKLRSTPGFLCPTMTEPWLRRYQVLPGRTHPMMSTSGSGGFIVNAIKIYDDPNASSVTARHPKTKKIKLEEPAPQTDSEMVDVPIQGGPSSTVQSVSQTVNAKIEGN